MQHLEGNLFLYFQLDTLLFCLRTISAIFFSIAVIVRKQKSSVSSWK